MWDFIKSSTVDSKYVIFRDTTTSLTRRAEGKVSHVHLEIVIFLGHTSPECKQDIMLSNSLHSNI
jgi:hypothetical protein